MTTRARELADRLGDWLKEELGTENRIVFSPIAMELIENFGIAERRVALEEAIKATREVFGHGPTFGEGAIRALINKPASEEPENG